MERDAICVIVLQIIDATSYETFIFLFYYSFLDLRLTVISVLVPVFPLAFSFPLFSKPSSGRLLRLMLIWAQAFRVLQLVLEVFLLIALF